MSSAVSYPKIWNVVQQVPLGCVASYGQVADLAGLPGRARLVGKAMQHIPESGHNAQPVPWYRVLRSSGQLAFPMGSEQFEHQKQLLLADGVIVKGRSVSLKQFQWQPSFTELLFQLSE